MQALGFTLFDTPIGSCGLAWSPAGITCLQLPEGSDGRTRSRLAAKAPAAPQTTPPPDVRAAMDGVVALLGGRAVDLTAVQLDLEEVPAFERRVYAVARAIPPGSTMTYGDIARRLGDIGAARAIGGALSRNPVPIIVPCHRVLASGGKLGGFSANGGIVTKLRLLAIEGWRPDGGPTLFDGVAGFELRLRP
jgi:methylated-DNA-[protein]-cysteine S-methyltransferase